MPKPLKVSWSGLKRWKKCSFSQKLVSEGKSHKARNGRVFLKGNLCDNAMRRWLENGDFSIPIEAYLKQIWEEHTGPGAQYPIKWKSPTDQEEIVESTRIALADLEEVLREKVVPYKYEPEMRFTSTIGVPNPDGEISHIELFGAIDIAILYPDDTIGIYDLKLSEDKGYITSSIGQLVLYDLAITNYLGKRPVKHGFFTPLLKKESVIDLDVTQEDRIQMAVDISQYALDYWSDNWNLTENVNDCYGCQVRHACPRWSKPLTLEVKNKNLINFGRKEPLV